MHYTYCNWYLCATALWHHGQLWYDHVPSIRAPPKNGQTENHLCFAGAAGKALWCSQWPAPRRDSRYDLWNSYSFNHILGKTFFDGVRLSGDVGLVLWGTQYLCWLFKSLAFFCWLNMWSFGKCCMVKFI